MRYTVLSLFTVSLVALAGCSGKITDSLPATATGTGASTGQPSVGQGGSGANAGSGSPKGGTGTGAAAGNANGLGSGGTSGASGASLGGSGTVGPTTAVFGPFTRLARAEYAATIESALGVSPPLTLIPEDGRLGQFTSNASVSPDPVHPYLLAAEDLATALIPSELPACDADDALACLSEDYRAPLEKLYRRPLTSAELTSFATMLETMVDGGASATEATRTVLVAALLSPDFLFRASPVASDAAQKARRLADTLSYALWDAPPDAELAAITKSPASELSTLLRAQATRLSSDGRATTVLARFLAQWLRVDTDLRLSDAAFASSPRYLELLAYVEDALTTNAPVQDLVAGKRGFVHRDNVKAYGITAAGGSAPVTAQVWADTSPRRGLLAQDLFADATRHPDESRRPIFRGKLVRTSLLCDTIEAPSADLLALASEVGDRTADPRCKGCHQLLDPIGRTFASLDTDHAGAVESAEVIDHLGLDGTYTNLAELLEAIAGSRSFADCFSRHFLSFFLEQPLEAADAGWVAELSDLVMAGASLGEVVAQTIVTLETRASTAVPWCEGS